MVIQLEKDRDVLAGIYYEVAEFYDWNRLLRIEGVELGEGNFADFINQWTQFYAVYLSGKLAGYVLLMNDYEIHFGALPWVPRVKLMRMIRDIYARFSESVPDLKANIPDDRPDIKRLWTWLTKAS